ncbi:EF-hand domain-containing protein [Salipiger aestuarii]|uniref:EF-hand domain-containing protein n=1 Tax=Salipiger aestuarii TaxID=568098 RepID=UPI001239D8C0|nr:EF-hand domain-containing protein [Salipiger aestuarii]
MTRRAKLLIGAAIAVIGTSSLAQTVPGDQPRGNGPGTDGAPMMAQMFQSLDTDGDGAVSREELSAAGPAAAFSEADTNGDGALEGDELTAFHDARKAAREARRQQMMLLRLDTDKDGKLSLEELQANGRGGPARIFERLDADDDGTVSAEEMAALDQRRSRMHDGGRPRHGEGRMGRDGLRDGRSGHMGAHRLGHGGDCDGNHRVDRRADMSRDHGPRDAGRAQTPPAQGDAAPMVEPLPGQPTD